MTPRPCVQFLSGVVTVLLLSTHACQHVAGTEAWGSIARLGLGSSLVGVRDQTIAEASSRGQAVLAASSEWQEQQLTVVPEGSLERVCWRLAAAEDATLLQVISCLLQQL